MIKPEMVPIEVCEALQNALLAAFSQTQETTYNKIIAAALNAWPEAKRVKGYFTHDTDYYEPAFILPLPTQENGDA